MSGRCDPDRREWWLRPNCGRWFLDALREMLIIRHVLVLTSIGAFSACLPSTACRSTSSANALSRAVEQKRGMLSRSVPSYRDNFASNDGRVLGRTDGGSTLVQFRGKNRQTLTARIDADCYVGWSTGNGS